jgi:hypothetical protein
VEVLDVVSGYNDDMHSSTRIALSHVTDAEVVSIWQKIGKLQTKIRSARAPRYSVGHTVRISKEKK